MKRKLVTVDAETLLFTPMSKTMFIVDELIPQGLPVWGIPTMQCDVLYLCLEDTYARIQSRLYQLTDEAPPELPQRAIRSDVVWNSRSSGISPIIR